MMASLSDTKNCILTFYLRKLSFSDIGKVSSSDIVSFRSPIENKHLSNVSYPFFGKKPVQQFIVIAFLLLETNWPTIQCCIVYTMGLKYFRRFFCLQKCNSTHFICHPCAQKLENYYVCQILSEFKEHCKVLDKTKYSPLSKVRLF